MKKRIYFTIVCILFLACSCSNRKSAVTEGNSAYYWRTSFVLSPAEREFIKEYGISRLYIRYFDVVMQEGDAMPNATLKFKDTLPSSVQPVPTVFIMNECMQKRDNTLANKIFKRILQISESNNINNVKEIQIDCDWTKRTEGNFLKFMEQLHALTQEKGIMLSTTVRCYQLNWQVPKADRGVVMMYNTGDFRNIKDEKPILNIDSVGGYLKYLKKYDLPLTCAYPVFKWDLLFHKENFREVLYTEDRSFLFQSDTVVRREPSLADILKAKERLQSIRKDINKEIVIFDLSDYNIKRFKDEEYKKIFAH
ncbi:MAG: hypothetical protein IJ748_06710 [Bacteroidales bacterium]|nr:hypothetical protein [Bacteroidales bacterium]